MLRCDGLWHALTVVDALPKPVSIWNDFPSEDGWKLTATGWITDDSYPFVYHDPAGWFMVYPKDASLDGYYAYDFFVQNWIWSTETLHGWRYNFGTEDWETW